MATAAGVSDGLCKQPKEPGSLIEEWAKLQTSSCPGQVLSLSSSAERQSKTMSDHCTPKGQLHTRGLLLTTHSSLGPLQGTFQNVPEGLPACKMFQKVVMYPLGNARTQALQLFLQKKQPVVWARAKPVVAGSETGPSSLASPECHLNLVPLSAAHPSQGALVHLPCMCLPHTLHAPPHCASPAPKVKH